MLHQHTEVWSRLQHTVKTDGVKGPSIEMPTVRLGACRALMGCLIQAKL